MYDEEHPKTFLMEGSRDFHYSQSKTKQSENAQKCKISYLTLKLSEHPGKRICTGEKAEKILHTWVCKPLGKHPLKEHRILKWTSLLRPRNTSKNSNDAGLQRTKPSSKETICSLCIVILFFGVNVLMLDCLSAQKKKRLCCSLHVCSL